MRKNIGTTERMLRIAIAVTIGILVLMNVFTGTAAAILGGIGLLLLATGLVGFCPAYAVLKAEKARAKR